MTNFDSRFFIIELLNRKDPHKLFKDIPQSDEWWLSIIYGRSWIFDSKIFMKMALDGIVEAPYLYDFIQIKSLFEGKREYFTKKLTYLYDCF